MKNLRGFNFNFLNCKYISLFSVVHNVGIKKVSPGKVGENYIIKVGE